VKDVTGDVRWVGCISEFRVQFRLEEFHGLKSVWASTRYLQEQWSVAKYSSETVGIDPG